MERLQGKEIDMCIQNTNKIFSVAKSGRRETVMKKFKVLFAITAVTLATLFAPVVSNQTTAKAATKASLEKVLQKNTSENVYKSYYSDVDADGKKELVAVTSSSGKDELGILFAKLWYVKGSSCKNFYTSSMSIGEADIKMFSAKNGKIFTISETAGGSSNKCSCFAFSGKKARRLSIEGESLERISNSYFKLLQGSFDGCTDGTGHAYNYYYFAWDGKNFLEYGGLKISQSMFKKAKGGTTILSQIKKQGKIKSIYFRGNNIININYESNGQNYNVTLSFKSGKVSYVDMYGTGKKNLQTATSWGISHKYSSQPKMTVIYPKSFM